jgi:hypothetical protein
MYSNLSNSNDFLLHPHFTEIDSMDGDDRDRDRKKLYYIQPYLPLHYNTNYITIIKGIYLCIYLSIIFTATLKY